LKPRSNAPGSCKVGVSIIKPKSSNDEQFVVDTKTIFYTWTTIAPLTLRIQAPDAASVGDDLPYQIIVTNLSDFTQDADVEITIPEGTEMTSAEQSPTQVSADKSRVVWSVKNLPEHSSYQLNFTLRKNVEGPVNLRVRFVKTAPTSPGLSGSTPQNSSVQPPTTLPQTSPTSPNMTSPNMTSPNMTPPSATSPNAYSSQGSSSTPSGTDGITPPTLSPDSGVDQADVRPSLN